MGAHAGSRAQRATATAAPQITVAVPAVLRASCAGAGALRLDPASVGDVLEQIEQLHPALHRSICDETGSVRRHINLFVNSVHVRERDGLATMLVPGDILTILPAVSGG